ncbi:ABC transporter substrate-binding protein [Leptolyngbya sp. 'hensonii']|uniref:ABC transporter substrate-binding protein n=1 Tax=Leptolyngbya sp. 'hensonii' TaxID=1922337 RepID=UPI00094FEC30|nr:ABC transporter substrate-binding protein [Leptolyngbya sp. 'hensonii']OLP17974.1 ABC transporter substrate-binding protein [Leptolyngbya sp. 'hensonii']
MRKRIVTLVVLFFLFFGLATCTNTPNPNPTSNTPTQQDGKFRVWWQQGFYPEEAEAIRKLVADWERKSGQKAELTLFSDKDIVRETENAIATGQTPDLMFNPAVDLTLIPRLAWDNKLADVSDVIEPIKSFYTPEGLATVNYKNKSQNKRSYYAVPIGLQSSHIHYWRPMLKEAGSDEKVPEGWDSFWKYWETAQDKLRAKGQKDIYGLGLPMSRAANDTFYIFGQFLEAYEVQLLDAQGQLQLDKPEVKQGITEALKKYTSFYQSKHVPPEAIDWNNADNNVTFLSRSTVMTINPSLSIPGSQRQDQQTYQTDMATIEWPNKPNDKPMTYLAGIKQIVIFENSVHKKEAKDLLAYLVQPENLAAFLKDSQGRFFPIMPKLLEDPFWANAKDPHISSAVRQYRFWRPYQQALNPAYTEVQAQNIWGSAILDVVKNGLSVEQATDKAIAKIKTIFSEWT